MKQQHKIAVIGAGYWAQNILRNLLKFPGVEIKYCVDLDERKLGALKNKIPDCTMLSTDYHSAVTDPEISSVLIITPVSTHYQIAKDALQAKKSVYVQKPMVETVDQAKELTELAKINQVTLLTAYTYVYSRGIHKICGLNDNRAFGNLLYYDSTRINLGIIQRDVNILWDLFCHDAAILLHLLKKTPNFVSAVGSCHNPRGLADIANVSLQYDGGFTAYCTCNWISPIKNRSIILAGDQKMAVFDDCSNEALKIYDSGFKINNDVFDYRTGDILIPKLGNQEAIYSELKHFFNCVDGLELPLTGGDFSVKVLKMVEAANKSMEYCGEPMPVK